MSMPSGIQLVVVLLALAAIVCAVGLHYEGLNWLPRHLARSQGARRSRVLRAVIGVMLLHFAEIWIFGLAFWWAASIPGAGSIGGAGTAGLFDAVYLSAMSYSTVGFGDVVPHGDIRFIAGTEAVVGLFLIAWSATFTYLEMEQNWNDQPRGPARRPDG